MSLSINRRRLSTPILSLLVFFLAAGLAHAQDVEDQNDELMRDTIERLSGLASRDYMTFDFGRERDSSAVSVVVAESQAMELVGQIRAELPDGFIAFAGTYLWLGDEVHERKIEVVIAEGRNQYDILRLARSDAVNHGMMTEDLIAWFQAREEEIEIDIWQASTDLIQATVLSGPKDMDSFVDDLYAFCPDIVDQGSGNKDDIRAMVGGYSMLYLWWD
ncbi:MAG: DUF4253 domain-containing protein [Woeseiaceae bacterium]|nr:DUF4253 domain-containing protein [Woeseiaceae bacterium]